MIQDKALRRRMARWLGFLVLVVSVAYIGREIARNWDALVAFEPQPGFLLSCGVLVLIYAILLFLLAEVWHRIIDLFGPEPRWRTYRSYMLSQITRYVPGNVVYLLGRAVLLRGGALNDKQLGLATLTELVCLPIAALIISALCIWLMPATALPLQVAHPASAGFVVVILAVFAVALGVYASKRGFRLSSLLLVIGLATIFFLGLGCIAGFVLNLIGDVPFELGIFAGVFSWLVGYVTPGAPGGLGPREAAFTLLLSEAMSPGSALIAAAVFRMVTVGGDVCCFVLGATFFRRKFN